MSRCRESLIRGGQHVGNRDNTPGSEYFTVAGGGSADGWRQTGAAHSGHCHGAGWSFAAGGRAGRAHRILCASPDYLARRGVPVASADLARHHCVIAGPSIGSAHWVLDGPRGEETVAVSGRFAANEMQAVGAAAIAGYGIAQLPYQVAEASVRDGRLRRVLDDYTTPVGGLYAVYPSSR